MRGRFRFTRGRPYRYQGLVMSFIELQFLILAQIAIDITIVIFVIFLIRTLRHPNKGKSFNKTAKIFESLLTDADNTAGRFKDQL